MEVYRYIYKYYRFRKYYYKWYKWFFENHPFKEHLYYYYLYYLNKLKKKFTLEPFTFSFNLTEIEKNFYIKIENKMKAINEWFWKNADWLLSKESIRYVWNTLIDTIKSIPGRVVDKFEKIKKNLDYYSQFFKVTGGLSKTQKEFKYLLLLYKEIGFFFNCFFLNSPEDKINFLKRYNTSQINKFLNKIFMHLYKEYIEFFVKIIRHIFIIKPIFFIRTLKIFILDFLSILLYPFSAVWWYFSDKYYNILKWYYHTSLYYKLKILDLFYNYMVNPIYNFFLEINKVYNLFVYTFSKNRSLKWVMNLYRSRAWLYYNKDSFFPTKKNLFEFDIDATLVRQIKILDKKKQIYIKEHNKNNNELKIKQEKLIRIYSKIYQNLNSKIVETYRYPLTPYEQVLNKAGIYESVIRNLILTDKNSHIRYREDLNDLYSNFYEWEEEDFKAWAEYNPKFKDYFFKEKMLKWEVQDIIREIVADDIMFLREEVDKQLYDPNDLEDWTKKIDLFDEKVIEIDTPIYNDFFERNPKITRRIIYFIENIYYGFLYQQWPIDFLRLLFIKIPYKIWYFLKYKHPDFWLHFFNIYLNPLTKDWVIWLILFKDNIQNIFNINLYHRFLIIFFNIPKDFYNKYHQNPVHNLNINKKWINQKIYLNYLTSLQKKVGFSQPNIESLIDFTQEFSNIKKKKRLEKNQNSLYFKLSLKYTDGFYEYFKNNILKSYKYKIKFNNYFIYNNNIYNKNLFYRYININDLALFYSLYLQYSIIYIFKQIINSMFSITINDIIFEKSKIEFSIVYYYSIIKTKCVKQIILFLKTLLDKEISINFEVLILNIMYNFYLKYPQINFKELNLDVSKIEKLKFSNNVSYSLKYIFFKENTILDCYVKIIFFLIDFFKLICESFLEFITYSYKTYITEFLIKYFLYPVYFILTKPLYYFIENLKPLFLDFILFFIRWYGNILREVFYINTLYYYKWCLLKKKENVVNSFFNLNYKEFSILILNLINKFINMIKFIFVKVDLFFSDERRLILLLTKKFLINIRYFTGYIFNENKNINLYWKDKTLFMFISVISVQQKLLIKYYILNSSLNEICMYYKFWCIKFISSLELFFDATLFIIPKLFIDFYSKISNIITQYLIFSDLIKPIFYWFLKLSRIDWIKTQYFNHYNYNKKLNYVYKYYVLSEKTYWYVESYSLYKTHSKFRNEFYYHKYAILHLSKDILLSIFSKLVIVPFEYFLKVLVTMVKIFEVLFNYFYYCFDYILRMSKIFWNDQTNPINLEFILIRIFYLFAFILEVSNRTIPFIFHVYLKKEFLEWYQNSTLFKYLDFVFKSDYSNPVSFLFYTWLKIRWFLNENFLKKQNIFVYFYTFMENMVQFIVKVISNIFSYNYSLYFSVKYFYATFIKYIIKNIYKPFIFIYDFFTNLVNLIVIFFGEIIYQIYKLILFINKYPLYISNNILSLQSEDLKKNYNKLYDYYKNKEELPSDNWYIKFKILLAYSIDNPFYLTKKVYKYLKNVINDIIEKEFSFLDIFYFVTKLYSRVDIGEFWWNNIFFIYVYSKLHKWYFSYKYKTKDGIDWIKYYFVIEKDMFRNLPDLFYKYAKVPEDKDYVQKLKFMKKPRYIEDILYEYPRINSIKKKKINMLTITRQIVDYFKFVRKMEISPQIKMEMLYKYINKHYINCISFFRSSNIEEWSRYDIRFFFTICQMVYTLEHNLYLNKEKFFDKKSNFFRDEMLSFVNFYKEYLEVNKEMFDKNENFSECQQFLNILEGLYLRTEKDVNIPLLTFADNSEEDINTLLKIFVTNFLIGLDKDIPFSEEINFPVFNKMKKHNMLQKDFGGYLRESFFHNEAVWPFTYRRFFYEKMKFKNWNHTTLTPSPESKGLTEKKIKNKMKKEQKLWENYLNQITLMTKKINDKSRIWDIFIWNKLNTKDKVYLKFNKKHTFITAQKLANTRKENLEIGQSKLKAKTTLPKLLSKEEYFWWRKLHKKRPDTNNFLTYIKKCQRNYFKDYTYYCYFNSPKTVSGFINFKKRGTAKAEDFWSNIGWKDWIENEKNRNIIAEKPPRYILGRYPLAAELEGVKQKENILTKIPHWVDIKYADRRLWEAHYFSGSVPNIKRKAFLQNHLKTRLRYRMHEKRANDTYNFLAFNQKIYNYYKDIFGLEFAYIYYHFPGQTLRFFDDNYSLDERIEFLRRYIIDAEGSTMLLNTSLLHKLNGGDFLRYIENVEDHFRYNTFNLYKYHILNLKNKSSEVFGDIWAYSSKYQQISDNVKYNLLDAIFYYRNHRDFQNNENDSKYITYGKHFRRTVLEFRKEIFPKWENSSRAQGLMIGWKIPWKRFHELDKIFPSRKIKFNKWPRFKETVFSYYLPKYSEENKESYRQRKALGFFRKNIGYGSNWELGYLTFRTRWKFMQRRLAADAAWFEAFNTTFFISSDIFVKYWQLDYQEPYFGRFAQNLKDDFLEDPDKILFPEEEQGTTYHFTNPYWFDFTALTRYKHLYDITHTARMNEIIRERMYSKPKCYHYWVFYDECDNNIVTNSIDNPLYYDSPEVEQIFFQDSASPIMEGIIDLHHDLMFFLIFILTFVFWILLSMIYYFSLTNTPFKNLVYINFYRYAEDIFIGLYEVLAYLDDYCTNQIRKYRKKGRGPKILYPTRYIKYKVIPVIEKFLKKKLSYFSEYLTPMDTLEQIYSITGVFNSYLYFSPEDYFKKNYADGVNFYSETRMANLDNYIKNYLEKKKKNINIVKSRLRLYIQEANIALLCFNVARKRKIGDKFMKRHLQFNVVLSHFLMNNRKYDTSDAFDAVLFLEKIPNFPRLFTHNTTIEIIWTTIPALILLMIAIPSFSLLYAMDQIWKATLTLKVNGNQWYWGYQYV